jgi:4-hydroxybenzoate polyprenyltransferase
VSGTARALLAAARPAHWLKNVPVGAGLLFGERATDPAAVRAAGAAFVSFCLVASAGYLANDVVDREADRAHPRRAARPVASGALSVRAAVAAAVALGAAGLALAFATLPLPAAAATAGYLALSLAYTAGLKRAVPVGIAVVVLGFLLRVLAGALAVEVDPSPWLLALTAVLAAALATAKRESEDRRARGEARPGLRRATDALLAASAAGYLAYTLAPGTVALHGTRALWITAAPVAAALLRFRSRLRRERAGRGTAEIAAGDPVLLALAAAWVGACAAVLYA